MTIEPQPSMKTNLSLFALASMVSGQLCVAQTNEPADDWKPASSNQQGKQYPQVNSERRVRARLFAPQAQSVMLDIGGVKYPLTKAEDGGWIGVFGLGQRIFDTTNIEHDAL